MVPDEMSSSAHAAKELHGWRWLTRGLAPWRVGCILLRAMGSRLDGEQGGAGEVEAMPLLRGMTNSTWPHRGSLSFPATTRLGSCHERQTELTLAVQC